ncbi:hypothetical protein SMGD1_0280 [Sulfurimonas gotlandica GD1]|uniref:Uncharacterized protein n=1 Tax=Sulfurimonas gotlandica (strain DSM 19862 / JCM 16533 / GD1) TaxID=929558 RepID=B6BL68_SULGG|nr:hypothetical protein [Sulfurimonas gotlandica]EDZ62017.1 hypothetical protein CBGD1_2596 [Sulfurimonas gotlandica GD1]EHP28807.1 hypothetical protein SMGD1_0280 [Sulfurimonas gotlandica GD1]
MKKVMLYLVIIGLSSTPLLAEWLWFNPSTQKCTNSLSPQEWAKDTNIVNVTNQGNIWTLHIKGGRSTWITNDRYTCAVVLMKKTNVNNLAGRR